MATTLGSTSGATIKKRSSSRSRRVGRGRARNTAGVIAGTTLGQAGPGVQLPGNLHIMMLLDKKKFTNVTIAEVGDNFAVCADKKPSRGVARRGSRSRRTARR